MKSTEEKLTECNDLARERAKQQVRSVVLESKEMLKLLEEKVSHLLKHFDDSPIEVAIQYGLWARDSLVSLYGPDLFE